MTKSMHEEQDHITGETLQNNPRKSCNDNVYTTKMATHRNIEDLPFLN